MTDSKNPYDAPDDSANKGRDRSERVVVAARPMDAFMISIACGTLSAMTGFYLFMIVIIFGLLSL